VEKKGKPFMMSINTHHKRLDVYPALKLVKGPSENFRSIRDKANNLLFLTDKKGVQKLV